MQIILILVYFSCSLLILPQEGSLLTLFQGGEETFNRLNVGNVF